METVVEVSDREDLIEKYLVWWNACNSFPMKRTDVKHIDVNAYGGIDERTGWDTYIIELDCQKPWGKFPIGFTDGPLE